ncbi:hypothetical protein Gmet_3625 [Geobacter metallireducens GS-15]|uniref:Lipoprotein n=1 Tax=Geobacter metallireducens (strain ATCC 53774 / DSM 7210 / GS-15) TaxID=269799 RepID=J7LYH8_GEOMG|nr:hypothetical protein Gmet_3625 [Geobacter metallireducens GS-15]
MPLKSLFSTFPACRILCLHSIPAFVSCQTSTFRCPPHLRKFYAK